MTYPEILTLIGVATTSIVSIINAVKSSNGRAAINDRLDTAQDKVDDIHVAVTGKK